MQTTIEKINAHIDGLFALLRTAKGDQRDQIWNCIEAAREIGRDLGADSDKHSSTRPIKFAGLRHGEVLAGVVP